MNWIKKHSDVIIILILSVISLIGIFQKVLNAYPFLIRNYIAYAVLIVLIILKSIRVSRIKTILGVVLIVGTFNAILYTHQDVFITLFVGKLNFFGFQPVSFLTLIGLILLDFKGAKAVIKSIIPKESSEDQLISQQKSIQRFKDKYQLYSRDQLKEIIDNPDSYQYFAVKAAKELLENE